MSKHTPGPWLRDGRSVYALQHGGWRKGEELLVNRFSAHVQRVPNCPDDEADANARLIAAAPELLEALNQVINNWTANAGPRGHHVGCVCSGSNDGKHSCATLVEAIEKARAAIAKAEGE